MHSVITRLLLVSLLLLGGTSEAGIFGWAAKGSKAVDKATPGATRAAPPKLTRQQVAGLAGVGAGAIYLEAAGGRVLLQTLESGADILAGGIDDVGKLVPKAPLPKGATRPLLVLDEASIEALGDRLRSLTEQGDVLVAHPRLGAMRVLELPGASGPALYKQLKPGLVAPIASRIGDDVADALLEPVMRENLFVATMFSSTDVDSLQALAKAAGDRLTDGSKLAAMHPQWLRHMRGKTLILAGHVEDGRFVARGPAGQVIHSVSLDDLEAAATANEFRILSAGCRSYCAGARAGFAQPVTDVGVAAGIAAAFEARTTADLLAAMGRTSPLVVSESTLHDFARTRMLHAASMERHAGSVQAAGYAIRFKGIAGPAPQSELLRGLGAWFLIGAFALLAMIRTSRAAFLRVFPVLPSPLLAERRTAYYLAWLGRELLFLVVGPCLAAVTVFTFLFGGWPHRLDIQAFLWNFLRHPLSSTVRLVLLLLGGLFVLVVYGAGLSLLIAPGVGLTSWALTSFEGVVFWILAAACLGYWVAAGWLGIRMHRKFLAWRDSRAQPA